MIYSHSTGMEHKVHKQSESIGHRGSAERPGYLSAGLRRHLEGGLEGSPLRGAQDGPGPLGPAGVPPSTAGPSVAPSGVEGPLWLPVLIVIITVAITLLCIQNKYQYFVIPLYLWSMSNLWSIYL